MRTRKRSGLGGRGAARARRGGPGVAGLRWFYAWRRAAGSQGGGDTSSAARASGSERVRGIPGPGPAPYVYYFLLIPHLVNSTSSSFFFGDKEISVGS